MDAMGIQQNLVNYINLVFAWLCNFDKSTHQLSFGVNQFMASQPSPP